MNPSQLQIAEKLKSLSLLELSDVTGSLVSFSPGHCGALLIEICRCLDQLHIFRHLSSNDRFKLPSQDFDLILRGWNIVFSLLLPRVGKLSGIPISESTSETWNTTLNLLHAAGRYVVLNRTAEMIRAGMVVGSITDGQLELAISERTQTDYFHDQVDFHRLVSFHRNFFDKTDRDRTTLAELRKKMSLLTFPWDTGKGRMVGYETDPDIDQYFLNEVTRQIFDLRSFAGLHPSAKLEGCCGADLTTIVTFIMSIYLKHIIFVDEAARRFENINYTMSQTIWSTNEELTSTLESLGTPRSTAEAVLRLITVRAEDAEFFRNEHAPCIPLLIELTEGYLLRPVSAIFRNPLSQICMLRETKSKQFLHAAQSHRENWMAEDLYALFAGNRFQRTQGQIKLRKDGQIITDIDAAIFDNLTEELVLIQLKWQDFSTSNFRAQQSKAKNFAEQVQKWATKTNRWIEEFGVRTLCRTLKIKLASKRQPSAIRLWAIGRSNARFRSFGHHPEPQVFVSPWTQLVRLRYMIGPGKNVFEEVERLAKAEEARLVNRLPRPYTMQTQGSQIIFKDIWSDLEDETFESEWSANPRQS